MKQALPTIGITRSIVSCNIAVLFENPVLNNAISADLRAYAGCTHDRELGVGLLLHRHVDVGKKFLPSNFVAL